MGIGACGRKYSFLKLSGKRHVLNMALLKMADMQHEGEGSCTRLPGA